MIDLLRLGFDKGISPEGLAEALRPHASDIPSEDLDRLAVLLEQYLRTVPDALATALGMSKNPHCGRAVAFATGAILTYVFDEEDLLPEASYGLVGLLDDAYLVHGFVSTLRRMFPFAEPSTVAYVAPDNRMSEVVASLLPEGVAASLRRTSESMIQVAQALFPSHPGTASADLAYQPEIRVSKALATEGKSAGSSPESRAAGEIRTG
jgi:uncharacterized membrane protein YkvA (DUF1232 family)